MLCLGFWQQGRSKLKLWPQINSLILFYVLLYILLYIFLYILLYILLHKCQSAVSDPLVRYLQRGLLCGQRPSDKTLAAIFGSPAARWNASA